MTKKLITYFFISVLFALTANAAADLPSERIVCNQTDGSFCFHSPRIQDLLSHGLRETLKGLLSKNELSPVIGSDLRSEVEKFLDDRMFLSGSRLKELHLNGFRSNVAIKPALVKHVETAHQALLAKLMIVRQAKFTVDLTYYIFRTDESGYTLLNELKEAIRRGVSVRVMIDSLGSINPKAITHPELKTLIDFAKENAGYMKDRFGRSTNHKARVEVVIFRSANPSHLLWNSFRKTSRMAFNQLSKHFPFLVKNREPLETVYINPNRRSHDKIIISDQNFPELSVAMIGGRNIANDYYRLPTPDVSTFEDLEVIVKNDPKSLLTKKGAITTDIADLYELLYFHSGNRVISENMLTPFMNFKKHYTNMDTYSRVVDKATRNEQETLGENFSSPDFGKKYLSEDFAFGNVDLLYTFDNVLRSLSDAPLDPADIKQGNKTFNENQISTQIQMYMAKEAKHIYIVSPYLWFSAEQILSFKLWLGANPERKLTIITNSIITTDNPLAQTLVDATLGPQLVLDRTYLSPNGGKKSYGADQIELYEYGRLDSTELGGSVQYGKMHAKGVYLEEQAASFITTYNADPRSQYLNSELGLVIFSKDHSAKVIHQMERWIQKSHLWGSMEYYAIRRHEKLSRTKREAAAKVNELYDALVKYKLVWLI